MSGDELLEMMALADPELVAAAEKMPVRRTWVRWAALAACLCLVCSSALALPYLEERIQDHDASWEKPMDSADTFPSHAEETYSYGVNRIFFNKAVSFSSGSPLYIPGYYRQVLPQQTLETITPNQLWALADCTGSAGFDGEDVLRDVELNITASGQAVQLHISSDDVPSGTGTWACESAEPAVLSYCNDREFFVYTWNQGERILLLAQTQIAQYRYQFTLTTDEAGISQAKETLYTLLVCFDSYDTGKPDFSQVYAAH